MLIKRSAALPERRPCWKRFQLSDEEIEAHKNRTERAVVRETRHQPICLSGSFVGDLCLQCAKTSETRNNNAMGNMIPKDTYRDNTAVDIPRPSRPAVVRIAFATAQPATESHGNERVKRTSSRRQRHM